MGSNGLVFSLFIIFFGAATLSTLALYTRQSLLVVYMLLGILLGPWGLKLVANSELVHQTGDIGIIFLLFLLGLNLHPQKLWRLLRKTAWVMVMSSIIFMVLGCSVGYLCGYTLTENLIIGAAMMFSSTIIGLKLLPTTVLHHQHTGDIMISVLLMQDLLAIVVLLALHGAGMGSLDWKDIALIVIALPTLLLSAFLVERWILFKLCRRFDRIREYLFLLAVAWCLGMAEFAKLLGLSYEVGAFIAGVSIASSPISFYISENLKPLRDFFLVLFFFSIGANFDLQYFSLIIYPALLLSMLLILLKPVVFRVLLHQVSESNRTAWEIGVRLGQVSEFSLLVAYLADRSGLIGDSVSCMIQAVTMVTFIVSSYWVVLHYPTPVAISDRLRRD